MGNVRLSYTNNNGVAQIIDENNFYPFGLRQTDNSSASTLNKNQYNGKEFQDELGLNLTAMDFRQYDNTLGRFNVIDPLAEQDYGITPYHFGYDNPVLFGDPSGLKAQAPESMENNIVPGSILAMFASGMNGLQIRDALEQQAWGPNFMIIHPGGGGGAVGSRYDGAGGVHLLTTNYKTGESGYFFKSISVTGKGKGHFYFDTEKNIWGYQDPEMIIKTTKTWFKSDNNLQYFEDTSKWGVRFYGLIPIIRSPWVEKGAAFTPGPFVLTSSEINHKTSIEDYALVHHESGHVLNSLVFGLPLYWLTIALPSVVNFQTGIGGEHSEFYTEKIANTLSDFIIGPSPLPNNYPKY